MYRQVKYIVKITQNNQKRAKKADQSVYVIIKSEKDQVKILSKPLLLEEQNQNSIVSTNDIEFNRLQLWNYQKMKLIQSYSVDFGSNEIQVLKCQKQNLSISIYKQFQVKGSNQKGQKTQKIHKYSADSMEKIQMCNAKYKKQWNSDGQKIRLESEEQQLSLQNIRRHTGGKIISMKEYHAY